MKKKQQAARKLEGEGSYSATRAYNEKLRAFEDNADVAGLAAQARQALDGPEGTELRRAEEQGKKRAATRGKTARR
jgi:hypothetical protein